MQLRSGSGGIRSRTSILWLSRPVVEAILGGCSHLPTGIDLNADVAVQTCRQMRRTRPRVPSPFLGSTTAAGLQEQCKEANALCKDQRWAEHMQAAAEQNEDQTWPDQWSRCCILPRSPSVFKDGVHSECVGGFVIPSLGHKRFHPWIQRDFLHFGTRSKSSPGRQLIKFIKFGVNGLAQCFPALLRSIWKERVQQGGGNANRF